MWERREFVHTISYYLDISASNFDLIIELRWNTLTSKCFTTRFIRIRPVQDSFRLVSKLIWNVNGLPRPMTMKQLKKQQKKNIPNNPYDLWWFGCAYFCWIISMFQRLILILKSIHIFIWSYVKYFFFFIYSCINLILFDHKY